MKKFLSYLLVLLTLVNSITPALATTTYTDSTEQVDYIEHSDEYDGTLVYAEIGSEFKVTIPKKVTLDGATKQGTYNVLVEGDIAGNEYVKVVPETYFLLYSKNKNSIPATVSQDRTGWSYSDFGTKANGLIETEGMTAGSWNGTFYFNIKLESSVSLNNSIIGGITNPDTGEETTPIVDATNITGAQKEQLLDALEESGQIESTDNIDTMINIKTPDNSLGGIEDITIDTTGVANPGDTVVIVQEKDNEWDYVSTETVTNNNEVKVPIKSTRPISFVQTQPDGTVHVHVYEENVTSEATCTTDGILSMLCSCNKNYNFSIPASHNLEVVEKVDSNGNLINKYYECTNCAYSILNLTKLFAGNELSHDCNNYLITKYDSVYHWKECSVCTKKTSVKAHTMSDKIWNYGYESCAYNSNYKQTCTECSYNITGTKPCTWDGSSWYRYSYDNNMSNGYHHYKRCSDCNSIIQHGYYYNGEYCPGSTDGYCYYYGTNGEKIYADCSTNGGKCVECGQTFYPYHMGNCQRTISSSQSADRKVKTQTYEWFCGSCNEVFGTYTVTQTMEYKNGYWWSTVIWDVNLAPGITFSSVHGSASITSSNYDNTSFTYEVNGQNIVAKSIRRIINWTANESSGDHNWFYAKDKNGGPLSCAMYTGRTIPELNAPAISKIEQIPLAENNGWITSEQITVSGTEENSTLIYYWILNEKKQSIYSGIAPVTNKNWTFSAIPDIEANANGKTYYIQTQDTYGNVLQKEFTVSKIDKKSPTINSITTPINWTKEKNYKFTAIDEGSGNVQIAFNNINEYVAMDKNGTTYTKEYQFSGDVYGEIIAAIYYTDAAGNVTTQFVKVHNLDNTAPTITNVTVDGKQITVTANDLNTELNMEGSGVSKYALTWTSAPPQDSDWQDSNILNVSTNGTYYIWVKDAVGNISECYQIRIIL